MQKPPFEDIKAAYRLHFHFAARTRYRKPLLAPAETQDSIGQLLREICDANDYHLLENHIDAIFVRALLSLRPHHAPSRVAQRIKGVLSRRLKQQYPAQFSSVKEGKLWSDRYFLRSVGTVKQAKMEGYIGGQAEHHEYTSQEVGRMKYVLDCPGWEDDESPIQIRYHIVLETQHHTRLFDPVVTDDLVLYFPQVAEKNGCAFRALTFVPDHAHFALRAPAKLSPQKLLESLMNNSWHWMTKHYRGALKLENAWDVWEPSAYIGRLAR